MTRPEILRSQGRGALHLRRGRLSTDTYSGRGSDRLACHGTGGRLGGERTRFPGCLRRVVGSSCGFGHGGCGDHHRLCSFDGRCLEGHGDGFGDHDRGGGLAVGVTRNGTARSLGGDPRGIRPGVLLWMESVPDGHHV